MRHATHGNNAQHSQHMHRAQSVTAQWAPVCVTVTFSEAHFPPLAKNLHKHSRPKVIRNKHTLDGHRDERDSRVWQLKCAHVGWGARMNKSMCANEGACKSNI